MFGKGQKVRIYAEETIPVDKVVSREYRATFRADLAKIRSCLLYILQVVKISIQKYTSRGGSYIVYANLEVRVGQMVCQSTKFATDDSV
jgi:hypothetical protein